MISIICCSIKNQLAQNLYLNVCSTIGNIEWELHCIDNFNFQNSICKVYNDAAAQAKGDILCFVHEDVIFRTVGWGEKLESSFNKLLNPGIIGVAGSRLIVSPQAGWYNFTNSLLNRYNLIQHYNTGLSEKLYINPEGEENSEVLILDGVFLAMTKEVWSEFKFNENLLQGFHFYDIELSIRVASKHINYITYAFELEHLSEGCINREWVNTFLLFDKTVDIKIKFLDKISVLQLRKEKGFKLRFLINNLIKFNFPITLVLKYLFPLFFINPVLLAKFMVKLLIKKFLNYEE